MVLKFLGISLFFQFIVPQFLKILRSLWLIYSQSHSEYISVKLLFINCNTLPLQDQGSFFRLAAGALILVLLPVFYLFLYLVQRYNFHIYKCFLTNQGFTPVLNSAIGQVAVIWRVELKSFAASQKLDGNQSHHDW